MSQRNNQQTINQDARRTPNIQQQFGVMGADVSILKLSKFAFLCLQSVSSINSNPS